MSYQHPIRETRQRLAAARLVSKVIKDEIVNANALAIILTESQFRTFLDRSAEFLLASALLFFKIEPDLTLGVSQVKFRYWRARFGINNTRLLLATFDDMSSYKVCCDYLLHANCSDLDDLLKYYNGRPSSIYHRVFHNNLVYVRDYISIIEERLNISRQKY